MTNRRKLALRNLMVALLVIELILLFPAVAFPDATVRRILFAVVLYTAIGLLLAFIFIAWAKLDQLRKDVDENELVACAQLQQLRARVAAQIALCDAHRADAAMDSELAQIFGGRSA